MPSATPTSVPRRIQPLPALVVNQIAAGEVVDRPASVVKELIDNALDASAHRITIELEQGGIELIRITDDGTGISPDDLPLAIAPHATSKIRSAEDLDHIATMGFRGEALASIASVSRLSIRSRTAADAGASQIEIEGDIAGTVKPAAGPIGTCVTVRNLFFNTPARRKFLRTPNTEQGHCVDMAIDLALSHPAIGFTIITDGRVSVDVPPDQSPRERVLALLGKEIEDQLLQVHVDRFDDTRGVAMWGLVGLPSVARATSKSQHVYLNGRPIRDKTVQHALREAYRGLIEPGRYPTAVLMIEMDPRAVDVNVHPAKTEVRFRDQSMIHSIVLRAVRDVLRAADLTPVVSAFNRPVAGADLPGAGNTPYANNSGGLGYNGGATSPRHDPSAPPFAAAYAAASASQAFTEFFTRTIPGRAGERLNYDAVRSAVAPVNAEIEAKQHLADTAPHTQIPGANVDPAADAPVSIAAQPFDQPADPLAAPRPASRLLQVHNSYVVTQDEHGLVIVDQHALHERAMFEYLLLRIGQGGGGGNLESQSLLLPIVVQLEPRQVTRIEDLRPLFARLGIVAEPMGPAAIGVQAFPSFLFERSVEPGEFIADVLEKADAEGFAPESEAALHEVLDMMACKAAIKAGDRMSERELDDLLKLRELVERSSNCPHGRPTSIRLTIGELEKRFGRA